MELLLICPIFFVLHSIHCLLLCIYTMSIIMVLVSVGDPKYYFRTHTESRKYINLHCRGHFSFICLVSEGPVKERGRTMCENIGAFRWPVKGKNVVLLGHMLSPEMKDQQNRLALLSLIGEPERQFKGVSASEGRSLCCPSFCISVRQECYRISLERAAEAEEQQSGMV